jgi:hypothetical protein
MFAGGVAVPAGLFVTEGAAAGIVAGTTRTQAGATALAQQVNRIDTATAPAAGSTLGDGVRLMAASAGLTIVVVNGAAFPVQLYANGSDTINGVTGATGVILPPQGAYLLVAAAGDGTWACEGIGAGAAGAYPTVSAVSGLTAKAGGGQSGATLCAAVINRFTTVATAADSGLMPAAKAGMQLTVTNAAANSMNVFPAAGEQINNAGANAAFALAGGKTASFTSAANGAWHAVLSA